MKLKRSAGILEILQNENEVRSIFLTGSD